MRLIRFGDKGFEKPGLKMKSGQIIDVSGFGEDYDESFFESDGITRLQEWYELNKSSCEIVAKDVRIGSPIKRPSKIICVGLNYSKHAAEGGMEIPSEPVLFFKATTAISGPYDDVIIPRGSKKTDWEVELAVVIGKTARYVEKSKAMNYVAGFMIHNDYSEREWQLEREGQWVKGKSCDTFAPLGPVLVTTDEIKDPHGLNLWLRVNGQLFQESNTSDLIFDIPTLISYISGFMTLLPGDIISTGTPAGVGLGQNPQKYLKQGDVVELGIDNLGVSKQQIVSYSDI